MGQKVDIYPLQAWEAAAIDKALASEPHWQAFYRLLWETGLRVSEALSLTRDSLRDGGIVVHILKRRGEFQDFYPLSEGLYATLQQLASPRYKYIFRSDKDKRKPYSRVAALLALRRACQRAGITRKIHPHNYRHSYGRRLAQAQLGLSPLDHRALVSAALGHASERHAWRYFRPGPAEVQEVRRRLAQEGFPQQ